MGETENLNRRSTLDSRVTNRNGFTGNVLTHDERMNGSKCPLARILWRFHSSDGPEFNFYPSGMNMAFKPLKRTSPHSSTHSCT